MANKKRVNTKSAEEFKHTIQFIVMSFKKQMQSIVGSDGKVNLDILLLLDPLKVMFENNIPDSLHAKSEFTQFKQKLDLLRNIGLDPDARKLLSQTVNSSIKNKTAVDVKVLMQNLATVVPADIPTERAQKILIEFIDEIITAVRAKITV